MKLLFDALADSSCLLDLRANSLEEAVTAAAGLLAQKGRIKPTAVDSTVKNIMTREYTNPSAIGHACAFPHFYSDEYSDPSLVFVRLHQPINLGALDRVAVRFIFLLIGPLSATATHLETMTTLARLMSDDEAHFEIGSSRTEQDLYQALETYQSKRMRSVPLKQSPTPEGFKSSYHPFAGIRDDIKRRLPHYLDDIKQGLQPKCIASILFLFFACLAPAITFGGLMADQTGGMIGPAEMLLGTAICGAIYALVAGGPLIILGGIGPLFVFTAILYRLCEDAGLGDHFLSIYGWVGIWTAGLTCLLAITNASNLMRYFTRFTDEIFSALMSLIFIYEAIKGMYKGFHDASLPGHTGYDEAFLALILAMGTFYIGTSLAGFRKSHYLTSWMREFLADFGPSIALLIMACVAMMFRGEVAVTSLEIGNSMSDNRPWMVDLFAVPTWTWFAAAGPAVLATVLIFLSQNITSRLVNSPDNKIKKGDSYHWDLMVVGLLVGFCSLFGFPWLVAATVRSLAHVRALAETEEVITSNGATTERIIHTTENRVTGFAIHILIGMSLLVLPLLAYVPKATLYGIFLFMGVMSLSGNQFMERLSLWIMDSNLYPATHYIRRVPNKVTHTFTIIQFSCLAVLCLLNVAKSEIIRITFPIFIALLVPIRRLLDRYFDHVHLSYLDADEVPEAEQSHWV